MGARNDSQLRAMLEPALQKAVEYVTEKIWEDNQEIVERVVYSAGSPEMYSRTYTFKEAWEHKAGGGGAISAEFMYAPEKLSYHPSVLDSGIDIREGLADIIYEGLAGHIFGTGFWTSKRNAFEALQKELGKNKIRKYFEEGMSAAGLTWKRRTGGISLS